MAFKLLFFCILLHTVFGQDGLGFGTSYLKDSRLCHQWTCINSKLGLPDGLPPKDQFVTVLKSLLPRGAWQDVPARVADTCYEDRPRRYTNTCPGQALLHCAFDHLIQYCPAESLSKDDACAPLTSLAGFKYMFAQSRYDNLEKNLPTERRPTWFLKHYFSSKCCNLPVLFNSTLLQGCGFDSMIHYHIHEPKPNNVQINNLAQKRIATSTTQKNIEVDQVRIVDINSKNVEATPKPGKDTVKIVDLNLTDADLNLDPLECCDLSGFMEPSWRSECDFQMTWSERDRLTIQDRIEQVTTTVAPVTARPVGNDVKVVPQACDKETCVFRKLNIITESGSVDLDAFSKLLDNVTNEHPSWVKAKARVVTKCLTKPIPDYIDDCDINRVLACTLDVLSENCPHAKKNDPCKHANVVKPDMTCQISASKLRPKNRRQFCGVPSLVNHEVLTQCGLNSLSRMEYVPDPVTPKPRTHWWTKSKFACQSSTDSTKCLLKKMGVLNKYGFLDYFKMKDKIRSFTSQRPEWSALTDMYLSTFTGIPMYGQQCSTPKKLLNVVDAMLVTCPISRRKHTLRCNRILTDMATTAPAAKQTNREKLRQYWSERVVTPPQPTPNIYFPKLPVVPEVPVTHKTPLYDFGLLNSKEAPKVKIIDVKPTTRPTTWKPFVLLPVYLRMTGNATGSLLIRRDGILRSAPLMPPHPQMPAQLEVPY